MHIKLLQVAKIQIIIKTKNISGGNLAFFDVFARNKTQSAFFIDNQNEEKVSKVSLRAKCYASKLRLSERRVMLA